MTREDALNRYLAESRAKAFRPGRHDCATFAAGWVKQIPGVDHARGWRSKYRTLERGKAMLAETGHKDHVAFVAAHLDECPVAFARTGDLAVVEGQGVGIVSAERVFVLRPDGLGHVSLMRAEKAFRV